MQVQTALYNGHEIVKTNHAPAVVHDSEDTLELAEITRKKKLEKMKIPLCVEKKVKIAPPDYSKENYLATFIPQRQLSAEHIFWSSVSKPISEMTVYTPNTPAKLVPRVLPTKKHFEGIQTALIKEVKKIKEIFEQIEAEVEQNALDKKCAEIKRKNLLIENENLLTDCLSNELLYSVMNAMNTVSQFSEMHDAYTVEQARNVELKAEISKLKHKIKKDDHIEMIKHFSNLEITRAKTIKKTSSLLTKNEKLKAHLKGKVECVTMNTIKPKVLAPGMYAIDVEPIPPRNRNNREVHLDYLKHLKESVEPLREIVEEARIEKPLDNTLENACFYTKRSQELLEYVIGTFPKEFNKRDKKADTTPLNRNKQVTFRKTCETSNNNTQTHVEQQKVQKTNVPVIPSTGVNNSTEASGPKPRSNIKNNRILPAKSDNKKKVEDHPRNNKSNLKQENRVDSSIGSKCTWKPTGRKFTLGEQCPLTRFTKSKVVPLQQPEHVSTSKIVITKRFSNTTQKPLTRYKRRHKKEKEISTGIPTTAETQIINAPVK
ncbi:hypothetical protein Tco_0724989, partial [Tanacetum coccineum]